MSITRINTFQAQEGQGDALRDLIGSFVSMIEASEGCLSCQLLQNQDDPAQIVVIEQWESADAHQASMKNIPPEALQAAMKPACETPNALASNPAVKFPKFPQGTEN